MKKEKKRRKEKNQKRWEKSEQINKGTVCQDRFKRFGMTQCQGWYNCKAEVKP